MKATIYHNPMCGTSRKTLEILRDSGCDVWIHEYLKNPPSRDELERLYDRAGITPARGLRAKEPLADELGLTRADVTDDEVLDAMVAAPDPDRTSARRDRQRRPPVPAAGQGARDLS